ncbi:MAG: hypothetical protein A2452_06670 [Candidatus Firestonebacteria bacterium RIFOXYC2_FULL_39_67]|nr:MAG: hypothetical protein A2452_06670 [Candidatus Firestonebacteria bacterium RIFOXYC2_FULL_39_67]
MALENIKIMLGVSRIPFLVLVPVCVFLGASSAVFEGAKIVYSDLIFIFLLWLFAHISVNALNEYYDFKSGLDFDTKPTPFSGGSKTLPNNPKKAFLGMAVGAVSLFPVFLIGMYFVLTKGVLFLPVLLLSIVTIITYTNFITRSPFLCLIAPGLGFGPMMVMGTHFALIGSYSWLSFIVSLVPFFLVSGLLLLNQFPDVEADKEAGRKHLLITSGKEAGVKVFVLFIVCPFLVIIAGYLSGFFPWKSLLGFIPVFLAIPVIKGVLKNSGDNYRLIPFMGMNVVLNILTPLLFAIGLLIS